MNSHFLGFTIKIFHYNFFTLYIAITTPMSKKVCNGGNFVQQWLKCGIKGMLVGNRRQLFSVVVVRHLWKTHALLNHNCLSTCNYKLLYFELFYSILTSIRDVSGFIQGIGHLISHFIHKIKQAWQF